VEKEMRERKKKYGGEPDEGRVSGEGTVPSSKQTGRIAARATYQRENWVLNRKRLLDEGEGGRRRSG